jgi:hypothetical protein
VIYYLLQPFCDVTSFCSVGWDRSIVVLHVPAIYVSPYLSLIFHGLLTHPAEELRLAEPSLAIPHWTLPIAM